MTCPTDRDFGKMYVCRGLKGRWRLEFAGSKWLVFKSCDIRRSEREGWAIMKVLRKDWQAERWSKA